MAVVDLLSLEPTTISRDLKGKFVCIYGLPKVGKTTLACQFPRNLLIAFEHGYNGIAGARVVDVSKWSEFKQFLRQLAKPEVRAMYDTITIDTIGIAWEQCEDFICAQNGVQQIGDIEWGRGYTAQKKEFSNALRQITQLGYGLVIIAHVKTRNEKRADDTDVEIIGPNIPDRAYEIVNQLVDIIGYIDIQFDKDGNSSRVLYTRKTPTVMAGSRFKYFPPKIPFGYDELVNAFDSALTKQEQLDGAVIVEKSENTAHIEELDFNTIRAEARELWGKLVTDDDEGRERLQTIMKKMEITFGHKVKLSEITEDQADLMYLVVLDMRAMAETL